MKMNELIVWIVTVEDAGVISDQRVFIVPTEPKKHDEMMEKADGFFVESIRAVAPNITEEELEEACKSGCWDQYGGNYRSVTMRYPTAVYTNEEGE